VTLARSKDIAGPYETHPANPLLTSYGNPDLYLQKAGHASICETPDGRVYMAYLCGRPLSGTKYCPLGRETSIIELEWRDGWLYTKYPEGAKRDSFGKMTANYPAPTFDPPVEINDDAARYSKPRKYMFDGGKDARLDRDFKTLRTRADPKIYSLSARPGFLRLKGGESPVSTFNQTLLARRQTDFSFDAETYMEFAPSSFHEFAGLTYRYDENNQYLLSFSRDEQRGLSLSVQSIVAHNYSRSGDTAIPAGTKGIYLGVSARGKSAMFRYSLDGVNWVSMRPVLDVTVLSDEFYHEGFTGAFVGIFCVDTAYYAATADFSYFAYTPVI
jgi:xylan 1,4-beta-xylosidase